MARQSEIVDIEATLIHETEKAYLIDAGTGENVWVPKSIVEHDERDGTFTMPRSYAENKGLV